MAKTLEERALERRHQIEQARAAFHNQESGYQAPQPKQEEQESAAVTSTLGIRIVIAAFLFACFVYFEQEHITFMGVDAQEIVRQVEWNAVPEEKLEELFGDVAVSKK